MKRSTVHIVFLLLVALFMTLSSCSGGGGDGGITSSGNGGTTGSGGSGGTAGSRQWTYMVYMGADNTLSDAGLADLNEMEKVGSSSDVAIVVQAEFSPKYTQGMTSSSTGRILVANDNDPNNPNLSSGTDIGNVNMASPAALTDFINWVKATYPAQHYALVVWDHGSGWKAKKFFSPARGAVQDETSGTFMSLPDLAKGVADSGVHFDVINFDACLMAMYEVAYEFKGLTDYMVFSEQTEPGEGDPYDTILGALAATPSMSGQTLASTIVSKYDAFYTTNDRGGTTKSAVDMSKLATLDTKVLALAAALKNDAASSAVVNTAITGTTTQNYAYPSNHDLWHVSDYLVYSAAGSAVKTAAGEVKTAVSDMVVANQTNGTDMTNSHGLAIYLPLASETNTTELASYSLLASNKTVRAAASGTWGSYLEKLVGAGGSATYKPGNFGVKVVWTDINDQPCNADVDLYIWEPTPTGSGDLFAPWMGQTSPNGFFSADSADSGKSEEYYLANAQVMVGDYYFLVNYYKDGASCTKAKVHLSVFDPLSFHDSAWHEATLQNISGLLNPSPRSMDLTNKWPGLTFADINASSDWWFPLAYSIKTAVDMPQFLSGSNLLELNKRSQIIFRYKKGSRLF